MNFFLFSQSFPHLYNIYTHTIIIQYSNRFHWSYSSFYLNHFGKQTDWRKWKPSIHSSNIDLCHILLCNVDRYKYYRFMTGVVCLIFIGKGGRGRRGRIMEKRKVNTKKKKCDAIIFFFSFCFFALWEEENFYQWIYFTIDQWNSSIHSSVLGFLFPFSVPLNF